MTTLSLSAIVSLGWKSGVAFSANHLLGLVLSGKSSEIWLNLDGSHTTASQSQNQVEGRFFLDVVVRKGSAIFELLSSEDESLLIRRDTFLVLNLSLDILNRVRWFSIGGDNFYKKCTNN